MLIKDFKIAIRNILRNKVQSTLSIPLMVIGPCSIILLVAIIVHKNSSDKYIPNIPNVYSKIIGKSPGTQYLPVEALRYE